ncbi:MAG: SLC13 family permease, partial [Candidatus Dormibacteraceae bacterium]
MAVIQVSLLVAAVLGVFWRPARIQNWSVPVASAVLLVAVGGIGLEAAADSLHPLLAPLAFLLLAVPLAVLLDRLGFFTSLAALVGRGPHSLLGLWVLAACVTTFLNLDASVVLLTPLYIRIARSRGLDATIVTLQPVLLACLASSALPISNLTNLIVAEQRGIGVL